MGTSASAEPSLIFVYRVRYQPGEPIVDAFVQCDCCYRDVRAAPFALFADCLRCGTRLQLPRTFEGEA